MDFLKRHYEKIILTILLVIFVGALFYLISMFLKAGKVSKRDLKITEKNANYKHLDFKKGYQALALLDKTVYIQQGKKGKNSIADFMAVEPVIFFPPSKKFIPRSLMGKKDPFSGLIVKKVEIKKVGPEPGKDSDADGIPDVVETKFKLNPNDASDADLDLDGDMFTNLEEYKGNTNMNDSKSHPLFATRLRVDKFSRKRLQVEVTQVDARDNDREDWEITLQVNEGARKRPKSYWKTRWKKLNDIVQIGGDGYKVVDIIPKKKKEIISGLEMEVDASMIIFQNALTGEKVIAYVKKKVYAPRLRVTLREVKSERIPKGLKNLVEGSKFVIGNAVAGLEKYKVLKIIKDRSVTIGGDKVKFKITKEKAKKLP